MVGWPYHHDRDLTGFIDGTENPTLVEATSVVLIPPGSPGEDGRSCCSSSGSTTRSRGRPAVATQEAIMGRRKPDSAEFDPPPPTSHVARTDQDAFGKIFRRNIAYGTVASHGTIFVGFSAEQRILAAMLESMIGTGDGPPDALTTVTRAISGAYYVIPSVDRLAALGVDDRV